MNMRTFHVHSPTSLLQKTSKLIVLEVLTFYHVKNNSFVFVMECENWMVITSQVCLKILACFGQLGCSCKELEEAEQTNLSIFHTFMWYSFPKLFKSFPFFMIENAVDRILSSTHVSLYTWTCVFYTSASLGLPIAAWKKWFRTMVLWYSSH